MNDLFRARLDQIINLRHELVRLGWSIVDLFHIIKPTLVNGGSIMYRRGGAKNVPESWWQLVPVVQTVAHQGR